MMVGAHPQAITASGSPPRERLLSPGIVSFTDSRIQAFKEEIRGRLEPAIPASWAEAKDLEDEAPAALEVRRQWDRARFEVGLACVGWPAEHGGNGFTPVEMVLYNEVLADLDAPNVYNMLGYLLAGTAIISWGNEEQQKRFLPPILEGTQTWCEGFSEPEGGADMANCQTTATRIGDGWHIEGSKIWTTLSPWGDRLYCLTRTSLTAPKRKNLSVFLLDMHAPGVSVRPIRQLTGVASFGQVFIDTDIKDSDNLLLGREGQGWDLSSLAGAHRSAGKPRASGAGGGYAERYIRRLGECARESTASAAVKEKAEELVVRFAAHGWRTKRIVELGQAGRDVSRANSTTKIAFSELVQAVTECGVELGCPTHAEFWRQKHIECRKHSIASGPNEIYRNMIANRVLGLVR
jgi:alkylation response protein AidB-like acyl-CoA dehydrogenase